VDKIVRLPENVRPCCLSPCFIFNNEIHGYLVWQICIRANCKSVDTHGPVHPSFDSKTFDEKRWRDASCQGA
jgi:hypothetical protein